MKMDIEWLHSHTWDFYSFATGTQLIFSDVDSLTELNGNFLLIEFKIPGKNKPLGQEILYQRLLETKKFTIVYAFGYPKQEIIERIEIYSKNGNFVIEKASLQRLRKICKDWESWAKQQPKPKFIDLNKIELKKID